MPGFPAISRALAPPWRVAPPISAVTLRAGPPGPPAGFPRPDGSRGRKAAPLASRSAAPPQPPFGVSGRYEEGALAAGCCCRRACDKNTNYIQSIIPRGGNVTVRPRDPRPGASGQ
eukprot:1143054-Prorocentrum_minimum.AAC.1